jgi:hypothetical protein
MTEALPTELDPRDAEIEEILAAGEAGLRDIMDVYEAVEPIYFAAIAASETTVQQAVYSTGT